MGMAIPVVAIRNLILNEEAPVLPHLGKRVLPAC